MIKDDLVATECKFIEVEAEILYIELHIQGFKRLIIGSFYRPPSSDPANLRELARSLSNIHAKFKEAIVVLAGDFNLADIDWTNRLVKTYRIFRCIDRGRVSTAPPIFDLKKKIIINRGKKKIGKKGLTFFVRKTGEN